MRRRRNIPRNMLQHLGSKQSQKCISCLFVIGGSDAACLSEVNRQVDKSLLDFSRRIACKENHRCYLEYWGKQRKGIIAAFEEDNIHCTTLYRGVVQHVSVKPRLHQELACNTLHFADVYGKERLLITF